MIRRVIALAFAGGLAACSAPSQVQAPPAPAAAPQGPAVQAMLDDLSERTFRFFWDTANPANGLVPDRYPTPSFSSVAAVGFGLSAYIVGAERGYVTRDAARARTLTTLRFLWNAPQGDAAQGMTGFHGFFYHFLDMKTGARSSNCELSTVDTALLLGGVLHAQSWYDRDDPEEAEIRRLADQIYRRVDWQWAQARPNAVVLGWDPETGFLAYDWRGYNEAMLVYVLALGSPTHALAPAAWSEWTSTYGRSWGKYEGIEHLGFAPMFGHQYSQIWIDFRGIRDQYMRERGLDYFENSRRAAYAQRAYALRNPLACAGYGPNVWGVTASDGPADAKIDGREFHSYAGRGMGPDHYDDCTIAPTGAAASIAFAPELAIPAIAEIKSRWGDQVYAKYGFLDAFNPTFTYPGRQGTGRVVPGAGWVDNDYLGIDQGPIVTMLANYRDESVWRTMRKNPYLRAGLRQAGFAGGWLDAEPAK